MTPGVSDGTLERCSGGARERHAGAGRRRAAGVRGQDRRRPALCLRPCRRSIGGAARATQEYVAGDLEMAADVQHDTIPDPGLPPAKTEGPAGDEPRSEAVAFRASVEGDGDWRKDQKDLDENARLVHEVGRVRGEFQELERSAATKIDDLRDHGRLRPRRRAARCRCAHRQGRRRPSGPARRRHDRLVLRGAARHAGE
ncbi:DUF6507 family protein [Streptomyces sp. NPDC003703]|uniref:DUF6507 family protein n=1 Tax=Streptomyces sp. NPDC003283 TaxID=3364681 RepID=UPI003673CE80